MSREEYELSQAAFMADLLPRGPGDPDWYGYPGEPEEEGDNDNASETSSQPF